MCATNISKLDRRPHVPWIGSNRSPQTGLDLFLLCRRSILNLLYLCNYGSPRSEISSFGILVSPLSNATSLIKIGFSKQELCPTSHDDLIIYFFSRVNLYDVPCVPIPTFGSENDTENYCPSSFCNFLWNFNLMLREKFMTFFPRSPAWNVIPESRKTLTSLDHISENIAKQDLKFGSELHQDVNSNGFYF